MRGLPSHNHRGKFGFTTKTPKTQTPFVRDGVLEDQIAMDFEDGNNYSPWTFKDAASGVGGRASFHIQGGDDGRYALWDATGLEARIERDNEDSPPERSLFTSGKYTQVKNGWSRGYCFSMDVIPLTESSKVSVSLYWYKLPSKERSAIRIASEVYTEEECRTNATFPIKHQKRICIPMLDSDDKPVKTNVKFPAVKPLGPLVQVEMVVERGTKIAIDNLRLEDCSAEFDIKQRPTPTKPPGLRAPMLSNSKYGSYWQQNPANIAKYNKKSDKKDSTKLNSITSPTASSTKPTPSTAPPPPPTLTPPAIWISPTNATITTRSTTTTTTKSTIKSTIKLTTKSTTTTTTMSSKTETPTFSRTPAEIIVTLPQDWGVKTETINLNKFVRNDPSGSTRDNSTDKNEMYTNETKTKSLKKNKEKSSSSSARQFVPSYILFPILVYLF